MDIITVGEKDQRNLKWSIDPGETEEKKKNLTVQTKTIHVKMTRENEWYKWRNK